MTSSSNDFEGLSLTRRAALARFALLAGGLASSSSLARAAFAVAAPPAGFNTGRRTVFAELVATYDRQPGSIVDTRGRDLVVDFASRYAAASDTYSIQVDALLDALEAAPDAGSFLRLSLSARRKELRAWFSAREPDDALMFKPRPSDSDEPATLAESSARALAAMRATARSLPPDAFDLDPVTGLPKYQPPSGPPVPITSGEPLGTRVRIRRQLRWNSYALLSSLFSDDRQPQDEVRF